MDSVQVPAQDVQDDQNDQIVFFDPSLSIALNETAGVDFSNDGEFGGETVQFNYQTMIPSVPYVSLPQPGPPSVDDLQPWNVVLAVPPPPPNRVLLPNTPLDTNLVDRFVDPWHRLILCAKVYFESGTPMHPWWPSEAERSARARREIFQAGEFTRALLQAPCWQPPFDMSDPLIPAQIRQLGTCEDPHPNIVGVIAGGYNVIHRKVTMAVKTHICTRIAAGCYGPVDHLSAYTVLHQPTIYPNANFVYPLGGIILSDIMTVILLGDMSTSILAHWNSSDRHPKNPIYTVALGIAYSRFAVCRAAGESLRFTKAEFNGEYNQAVQLVCNLIANPMYAQLYFRLENYWLANRGQYWATQHFQI